LPEGFNEGNDRVLRSIAGKFRISFLLLLVFVIHLISMDNTKNENNEPQVPPQVSRETVELAVELLLKLISSSPKDQKPERPDGFISLIVILKSDNTKVVPRKSYIPVPHPLFTFDGSRETCLIIGDEKQALNTEVAENKIKEEGLPISKVFQFSKLKADYRRTKDSRNLCLSFDLFMACKAVFPMVYGFYLPLRRHLIPVDLSHERWKGELESACSLTSITIKHSSRVAQVARVSQTSKEIVENVVAVIDSLVSEIPEKWNNIISMHLLSVGSLQCPLYQSFPEPEAESKTDESGMNGKGGITGGFSSKKRTKDAEKTPVAKRKKGLSSEGKAGSFNGLDVNDGVPKDDSPSASGLEDKNESVDLPGGAVASSVETPAQKKKSRSRNKSSVRAV